MNIQPTLRPAVRAATQVDIPFLAQMDIEASSQPFGSPYWAELLDGTGTTPVAFAEAMLRAGASNWGQVSDFLIVEVDGTPAATCSVFRPRTDNAQAGPLDLTKLSAIAQALGWTDTARDSVRGRYVEAFDGNADYLKPQADLIIETVAVDPAFRGQRLGHALMEAAFDRGRALGASSIGIMVIHGNSTAQALYEKHFTPYVTYHSAYFDHSFPGVTKYRADLT